MYSYYDEETDACQVDCGMEVDNRKDDEGYLEEDKYYEVIALNWESQTKQLCS